MNADLRRGNRSIVTPLLPWFLLGVAVVACCLCVGWALAWRARARNATDELARLRVYQAAAARFPRHLPPRPRGRPSA